MAGPRASLGGITQGALWIHVLEISRAVGLGVSGVRTVVLGLAAAASVVVGFTPRRVLGWGAGPAAWAIALAATAWTIELPVLWNPSILPLPLALFLVALVSLAARGDLPSTAAMAVSLSLSVDAHVICLALVPLALAVMVATAARPVLALVVTMALVVGVSLLSSVGAVVLDLPDLAAGWKPCAALVIGPLVVGLIARRRAVAASAGRRVGVVLLVSCGYLTAVGAVACIASGHALAPRYFAPLAPFVSVLVAVVTTRLLGRRWGNVIMALVVAGVVVLTRPSRAGGRTPWTMLDAEALAPSLTARGWTFGNLWRHLRGPQTHALLASLAPFLPPPDVRPRLIEDDLLLLKVPRASVSSSPPGWLVVDLPDGALSVGRQAPSSMDARLLGESDPDRGAVGTFTQRAYPRLDLGPGETLPGGVVHWTLALPLRSRQEGLPHRLELAHQRPPWWIERTEGARHPESLPAQEVTLEQVTENGQIVFGVDVPARDREGFHPWLPDVVETSRDEVALRALAKDAVGGPP